MTAPIRTCPDHGPFSVDAGGESDGDEDAGCPVCGTRGTELLSGARRRRLSKFASGALRHFPADAGLSVDERGWTDYDVLVSAVEGKYDWASESHLAAVIATDPKGRFECAGEADGTAGRTDADADADTTEPDRVRAAYGHSIDVDLGSESRYATDSRTRSGARSERSDDRDANGEYGRSASEATRETAPVPDELYHGTDPENLPSVRTEGLKPMSRQQVHLSESQKAARQVGRRHTAEPVVLVVDAAELLADGQRITKRGRETYTTDAVAPSYLDRIE